MGTLADGGNYAGIGLTDVVLNPDGSGSGVISSYTGPYAGTIVSITGTGPTYTLQINYAGGGVETLPITTSYISDPGIVYDNPGGVLYNFNYPGYDTNPVYEYIVSGPLSYDYGEVVTFTAAQNDYVACYVSGTRIRTVDGDRPIESLSVGDLIVTNEGLKPVTWVGYVTRRSDEFPEINRVDFWPILFRAGSLGDSVPSDDLMVSPCHGMFMDGGLVPAWRLLNDDTIVRATWISEVTYYHIELGEHSVIFAEGAPSESFFEFDNCHRQFENGPTYVVRAFHGERLPEHLGEAAIHAFKLRQPCQFSIAN